MALWIGMPAIVFLLPTMLSNQIEALPDILQTVISWLPTVALSRGLTYTLYENPMSTSVLSQAGIIALWCVGLFGLIVWRMRQLDR